MATNITCIKKLSGSLVLPLRNFAAARTILGSRAATPEGVLPEPKYKGWGSNRVLLPDTADVSLDRLSWCYDFSGHSWGYTDTHPAVPFVKFIALTEGTADFLVVWEHGDSHTGLHVEDGKAYKRTVEFVLK